MSSLAVRIKKKLDEKGISAYKLEKQAGLKRSAINNILYGKSRSPGIDIIQSIAKGLNCSVNELLGDDALGLEPTKSPDINSYFLECIYTPPKNQELYCLTVQVIGSLLEKKPPLLTREEIFNCIEETYNYSLKANKKEVDLYFAEWITNKIYHARK